MTRVLVVLALLAAVAAVGGRPPTAGGAEHLAAPPLAATSASPTTSPTTTTSPAPSTTTTPPVAETTETTEAERSFTMAFTGDFLLHQPVNSAAAAHAATRDDRDYDYRPLLEPIRERIESADWAVCHMELPLSADGTRLATYPAFRVPGQIAFDARDVGYDACSVASNHTLDQGVEGVAETLEVFDDAGLAFTGAARSPSEAASQIWFEIGGVRVAHLSYTYWFNGYQLPADAPWTSNQIDEERILSDAAAARAGGAEYVVLSLHWGDEYRHQPNQQQAELGPRLLASPDIDLVIGHHAHVVQPIDRVGDEWLVYGLGNVLSNTQRTAGRDELLVEVTVTEEAGGGFATDLEVIPLYADPVTMTVHPSSPPPADPEAPAAALEASLARVIEVLETGTGWPDLRLAGAGRPGQQHDRPPPIR